MDTVDKLQSGKVRVRGGSAAGRLAQKAHAADTATAAKPGMTLVEAKVIIQNLLARVAALEARLGD